MRACAPPTCDPRTLAAIALAGACTGLAIGGVAAMGAHDGGPAPTAATRQAFEATAPALRPRSTPSFSWALPPPPAPLRLAAAGRDLECLTDAVYYEARGEPAEGQAAVAQVVLNRARKPGFPKSVCGVVFQRAGRACQFSFACDGSVTARRDGASWIRARRVAARALAGYALAEIGGATHFHVAGLRVDWGSGFAQVARIGAHVFYGFGGQHLVKARTTSDVELSPAVLTLPVGGAVATAPSSTAAPASAPAA